MKYNKLLGLAVKGKRQSLNVAKLFRQSAAVETSQEKQLLKIKKDLIFKRVSILRTLSKEKEDKKSGLDLLPILGGLGVGGLARGLSGIRRPSAGGGFRGGGGIRPRTPKGPIKPPVGGLRRLARGARGVPGLNALMTGLDFASRKAEGQTNLQAGVGAGAGLAGSLVGGAIGQALIPIPGVGFVAGSIVGGMLAGSVADNLSGSDLDRRRREQIKKTIISYEKTPFGSSLDKFEKAIEKLENLDISELRKDEEEDEDATPIGIDGQLAEYVKKLEQQLKDSKKVYKTAFGHGFAAGIAASATAVGIAMFATRGKLFRGTKGAVGRGAAKEVTLDFVFEAFKKKRVPTPKVSTRNTPAGQRADQKFRRDLELDTPQGASAAQQAAKDMTSDAQRGLEKLLGIGGGRPIPKGTAPPSKSSAIQPSPAGRIIKKTQEPTTIDVKPIQSKVTGRTIGKRKGSIEQTIIENVDDAASGVPNSLMDIYRRMSTKDLFQRLRQLEKSRMQRLIKKRTREEIDIQDIIDERSGILGERLLPRSGIDKIGPQSSTKPPGSTNIAMMAAPAAAAPIVIDSGNKGGITVIQDDSSVAFYKAIRSARYNA